MRPGQYLKHRLHRGDAKNAKHLIVSDKEFLCVLRVSAVNFFMYGIDMPQIVCRCPCGFQAGAITFGMLDRPSSRAGARANSP